MATQNFKYCCACPSEGTRGDPTPTMSWLLPLVLMNSAKRLWFLQLQPQDFQGSPMGLVVFFLIPIFRKTM